MTTQYLYDVARRLGYEKIYGSAAIIYTNTLDAAGRTVETVRIGTDDSEIMLSGTQYDLAGEVLAETNALNGVTLRTRRNDPTTGGLIRTAVNPDGGTLTNFYYLDGSIKQTMGTSVHGMTNAIGVEYDSVCGIYSLYSQPAKLNTDGSVSSEWTKTDVDMLGRSYLTTYADDSTSQTFYNSLGQLWEQIDPDGVTTLYAYNAKGERISTAIDPNNVDRATYTLNDVTTDHSTPVRRTRTYVCASTGSSASNLVAISEVSANGLTNWQSVYPDGVTPVTTTNEVFPGTNRTQTTVMPDGSYAISLYSYGLLASVTKYPSTGSQIGQTTYGYDAQGRQNTITDARNGTTSYTYNNADVVASVTTPNPGGVGSAETTTTIYDAMSRATNVLQPDGTSVTMIYLPTGELGETYGSRTYPVAYGYDYAGRMQTMTNWSNFATGAGARVTTWNYDAYRGFLTSKLDASGLGPSYTYTAAGRLASRTWARGTNRQYSYNTTGDLATVVYSDGTPGVTNTYDRLGRKSSVVCGATTTSFAYDWANDVLSESYAGGFLNGLTVTNTFDTDLRRTSVGLRNGSGTLCQASYGYDNASRLASVSDGNGNTAAYSYLANSPLVGEIVCQQSGTTRMTTTKQYDYLNRLGSISSSPSSSFIYQYNAANQRTLNRLWDGSYWRYGYDALGQVTSGNKYWSDMTPVTGQQFGYAFDTIGNRTSAQAGSIGNLSTFSYAVNGLNEYTNIVTPGSKDILGLAIATNAVTVNGGLADRKGEYFHKAITVSNSGGPVWQEVTNSAGGASVIGGLVFPASSQALVYDADGNLTFDGIWTYQWDTENRLISMSMTNIAGIANSNRLRLDFAYDYMNRRVSKMVSTNSTGSSFVPEWTNYFIYDGWNLIGELAPNGSPIRSYVWGSDLSGSMQGAGGVGGLIEVSYYGAATTNCFVAFDGNGNVSALVNAADGTILANYEYGPFGELIRATGLLAKVNPFLFSTKYYDWETGLYYYGYRYYNPIPGKWLSKDPAGERGGINLYGFLHNDGIDHVDYLGLIKYSAIQSMVQATDVVLSKQKCCCSCPKTAYVRENSLTGTASGASVTVTGRVLWQSCVDTISFVWWNCADAQAEAGFLGTHVMPDSYWQQFGWTPGNQVYSPFQGNNCGGGMLTESHTQSHIGGTGVILGVDVGDTMHWNWMFAVIYTYCGKDGHRHASLTDPTSEFTFTWDPITNDWFPPWHPPAL